MTATRVGKIGSLCADLRLLDVDDGSHVPVAAKTRCNPPPPVNAAPFSLKAISSPKLNLSTGVASALHATANADKFTQRDRHLTSFSSDVVTLLFLLSLHLNSKGTTPCSKDHWKPAEDAILRDLVQKHGPQNWNQIAQCIEGRTGQSCRFRWFNELDPRVLKRAFTKEEEEKLLAAQRFYGNKWAVISQFFPGRTNNAVKNH